MYGTHTNAYGSKLDLTVKRSNVNVNHHFSNFGRPLVPPWWFVQRFSPKASSVLEKKIFKGFYHIWAWLPSWSMDRDHFSNLSFSQPKEAPHKIWEWPRGFRGEVIWNSQHFSHTNVWCPYKCIGKQTWPHHKKVKPQCTTIILATLVDLSSLMICAKIQPKGILGSGEDF